MGLGDRHERENARATRLLAGQRIEVVEVVDAEGRTYNHYLMLRLSNKKRLKIAYFELVDIDESDSIRNLSSNQMSAATHVFSAEEIKKKTAKEEQERRYRKRDRARSLVSQYRKAKEAMEKAGVKPSDHPSA